MSTNLFNSLFVIYRNVKRHALCMVDFDSDFKADSSNNRKKGAGFNENDAFAVRCARHGCVERIHDITGGEGHKYVIACVNHVVDHMPAHQKKDPGHV
ncbi:hypothetical protein [Parasitella parasitica]|uniref:Uncharacterized protein n=1 Tax=Parasitella parasitica TaxID=35722 RepID=A0A0B7N7X1_9FUNG|nr:hypothetical protein [Parasitella parasitica]